MKGTRSLNNAEIRQVSASFTRPINVDKFLYFLVEGAVLWFYEIGPGRQFESYKAFFGRDRFLAELLDEWFPRVSFWEYF